MMTSWEETGEAEEKQAEQEGRQVWFAVLSCCSGAGVMSVLSVCYSTSYRGDITHGVVVVVVLGLGLKSHQKEINKPTTSSCHFERKMV